MLACPPHLSPIFVSTPKKRTSHNPSFPREGMAHYRHRELTMATNKHGSTTGGIEKVQGEIAGGPCYSPTADTHEATLRFATAPRERGLSQRHERTTLFTYFANIMTTMSSFCDPRLCALHPQTIFEWKSAATYFTSSSSTQRRRRHDFVSQSAQEPAKIPRPAPASARPLMDPRLKTTLMRAGPDIAHTPRTRCQHAALLLLGIFRHDAPDQQRAANIAYSQTRMYCRFENEDYNPVYLERHQQKRPIYRRRHRKDAAEITILPPSNSG